MSNIEMSFCVPLHSYSASLLIRRNRRQEESCSSKDLRWHVDGEQGHDGEHGECQRPTSIVTSKHHIPYHTMCFICKTFTHTTKPTFRFTHTVSHTLCLSYVRMLTHTTYFTLKHKLCLICKNAYTHNEFEQNISVQNTFEYSIPHSRLPTVEFFTFK